MEIEVKLTDEPAEVLGCVCPSCHRTSLKVTHRFADGRFGVGCPDCGATFDARYMEMKK